MCGITGFWQLDGLDREAPALLSRMTDCIAHRGPDDAGQWLDGEVGIALGHRRLSILDLSPEGHQPMASPSGRFVVVFNGEVYNFRELREAEERAGARFRGHSDTEVLLAAIERRGVDEAIRASAGMFALALWDREKRQLHLIRDRIGEKPLYYGRFGRALVFGSELKALRAHPAWEAEIDRGALTGYLRFACVPAPGSIYQGVKKVLPGHRVSFDGAGGEASRPYWCLEEIIQRGREAPLEGDADEVADTVEGALRTTIGQEMVADVPLGAFLSGGLDSTTIVALMQAQSPRPVRTFTMGFNEPGFNEAEAAKAVARHLGTDHTELYVTPDEARAVIPRLPTLYDEPFGDASQIPTFLVAQLARRHVTVALSGDGGDELFGGYNRYGIGQRLWKGIRPVPAWMRRAAAASMRRVSPSAWNTAFGVVQAVLPRRLHLPQAGDRVHKLADVLALPSAAMMYQHLISHWTAPGEVVIGGQEPDTLRRAESRLPRGLHLVEQMMGLDTLTYLTDDIMVKVDRAAMGVSLESRAPFLDHRIVELAWRIPLEHKIRAGKGKQVLRRILARHVPPALWERPKMGFGVPIDQWLRGPLRAWAEALLEPGRLRRDGLLQPGPIRAKWDEHLSGRRNWQYLLWDVLMFQAWYEAQ